MPVVIVSSPIVKKLEVVNEEAEKLRQALLQFHGALDVYLSTKDTVAGMTALQRGAVADQQFQKLIAATQDLTEGARERWRTFLQEAERLRDDLLSQIQAQA